VFEMLDRAGMTLMEICMIMIIAAIVIVFTFPTFTGPLEHAQAISAQNNLLAIYSAQKNYINEHGLGVGYCTTSMIPATQATLCATWGVNAGDTCGFQLPDLNCNLNLNIQDDGTYTYTCTSTNNQTNFTCTATRTNPQVPLVLTITNTLPIQMRIGANPNPSCSSNNNWCP
jgi:type II secretory pathway pseudopilin PulG